MNFRDRMIADIQSVFLNPNEFPVIHELDDGANGVRRLLMIVETYTLDGKLVQSVEGIVVQNIVVHIDSRVLGYIPDVMTEFKIDGVRYVITGVANEFGMLKIAMTANTG